MKANRKAIAQFGVLRRAIFHGSEQAVFTAQITAVRRQKQASAQRQAEIASISFVAGFKPDAQILFIPPRLRSPTDLTLLRLVGMHAPLAYA